MGWRLKATIDNYRSTLQARNSIIKSHVRYLVNPSLNVSSVPLPSAIYFVVVTSSKDQIPLPVRGISLKSSVK